MAAAVTALSSRVCEDGCALMKEEIEKCQRKCAGRANELLSLFTGGHREKKKLATLFDFFFQCILFIASFKFESQLTTNFFYTGLLNEFRLKCLQTIFFCVCGCVG